MLTIEYVKNAQWSNPERTHMICDIKFEEFNEEFNDYGAMPADPTQHVQDLIKGVMDGTYECDTNPKYTSEEWDALINPVINETAPVSTGTQEF